MVLVDTTVKDPSFAVSQVASDNEGGGAAAFDAIKAKNPNGGKVLVISTDPGISTVDARVKGFEDAAAEDSAFKYLGVQYSHNDPATAAQLVTAALQKDPDIVGIFATNLFSAEGTATGVQQAGKGDQITIVGFDAGPNQVKALKDGTVQALVAQQPATIGSDGVDQADRRARRRHRSPRRSRPGSPSSPPTTSTPPTPSTSPPASRDPGLRVPAGPPPSAGTRPDTTSRRTHQHELLPLHCSHSHPFHEPTGGTS